MTVANTTSRNQYTATSGQTVFPYTFEIFDKGDVVVLKNGTALSEGTNYTVSGVGNDNGGNITLTVGATAGDILTIYRDMAYQRTTDYQTSGDFLAQEVNDDFDRLWLAVQQNEQANDRAIVKPITDAASIDMTLPSAADRANSYLTFDATGAPSVVAAGDPSAPDAITRQDFTGDGSTVVYTLASAPGAAGAGVMIFIDGIQQDKDSYTITGTTLTFSEAPPLNSNINLVQLKATSIGEADSASVTYIPAGTGAVQTSVQSKLRETVSVKDFGAVGDGVTDDTAAIQAALTYATPSSSATFTSVGGNAVYFPAGKYRFTGAILIPEWVNLIGDGKGLTVLLAAGATSKIQFGTTSADNRGGSSFGFTIDGNSVATNGLYVGLAVERDFSDIDVVNCAGDGLIVESGQNNNFISCGFQHNGSAGSGSNVVLDLGAGNNRFIGCEINRGAQNNVRIRQTGASPAGAFSVPTNNRFYGCMIERFNDETNFNGCIYQGNGRLNKFDKCDISVTGVTATANLPAVRMERTDTSKASTQLLFDSCSFEGSASYTTVFDGQGSSGFTINAKFTGHTFFENHDKVFRLNDYCFIDIQSFSDSSGGTFFTGLGSLGQNTLVTSSIDSVVLNMKNNSAASDVQYVSVDGEAYPRWVWRPNGLTAGSGSAPTDVTLARETAAGVAAWAIKGHIKVNNTAAVLSAGSGAPTAGFANGSIYLRTDGSGTTDNLYVRRGGAWVGIA